MDVECFTVHVRPHIKPVYPILPSGLALHENGRDPAYHEKCNINAKHYFYAFLI
jgi:hypothetical protein